MIDKSCIPHPRKRWYWLISIPYVALIALTTIYLFNENINVAIIYLSLYIGSNIIHGYNCSFSPCPYVGTFCPGAFGWFWVGKIAKLFQQIGLSKSNSLINLFFMFIMISLLGIIILPTFWLANLGLVFVIGYVIFFVVHFYFFLVLMCTKCAGRKACPTARLSSAITGKNKQ